MNKIIITIIVLFMMVLSNIVIADYNDIPFTVTRIKYSNGTLFSGSNYTNVSFFNSYTGGTFLYSQRSLIQYDNGTASFFVYDVPSTVLNADVVYAQINLETFNFTPRVNLSRLKLYNTSYEIFAVSNNGSYVTSVGGTSPIVSSGGKTPTITFNPIDIAIGWANLTNYPSACSAGQFISALGDTSTCGTPTDTDTDTKWTLNTTWFLNISDFLNPNLTTWDSRFVLSSWTNVTYDTELQNSTIIRTSNTTWITSNQLFNTTVQIFAIVNNGSMQRKLNNNCSAGTFPQTFHDNGTIVCATDTSGSFSNGTDINVSRLWVNNQLVFYLLSNCDVKTYVNGSLYCGTDLDTDTGISILFNTYDLLNISGTLYINSTTLNNTYAKLTGKLGNSTVEIFGVANNMSFNRKAMNNCSNTDKVSAFNDNGSIVCTADVSGTGGDVNNSDVNVSRLWVINQAVFSFLSGCDVKTYTNGSFYCGTDAVNTTLDIWNIVNNGTMVDYLRLNNLTIVRNTNTSWITSNQLFNTTVQVWAIAGNGTLELNITAKYCTPTQKLFNYSDSTFTCTEDLVNTTVQIQNVAVGGETSGTVGSITLSDTALDDQYILTDGDTTITNSYDFDSGTLLINATNNMVGINVSIPTSTLNVRGTFNISDSDGIGIWVNTSGCINIKGRSGSIVRIC